MDTEISIEEITKRLSWVEFLAPLSEEELKDLALEADLIRIEKGEELTVGPEKQAEGMLLLVLGQVQVYEVGLDSGREHTLWVLESGSLVSATGLVPRWVRDLHLRALEPSLMCRIDPEDVEALVERNPKVGLRLARTLATDLMLMEDRWADMVEKEVSKRLAALIYMLAEEVGVMSYEGPMIPTRYTHRQLGSMIGANREAVTRAIKELREEGCIEVRSRQIYVKDFGALRRCAGE